MNLNASFCIVVAITMLAVNLLSAADHPAEVAAERLIQAKDQYLKAENAFLKYVDLITDKPKRDATLQAFKERKELWTKLSKSDITLKSAASPLPDTSTSSSLIPYWTEIHYLKLQSGLLKEQTDWIRQNWESKVQN